MHAVSALCHDPRCFATCLCVPLVPIGLPCGVLLMMASEGLICLFELTHGRGSVAEQSETTFDRGVKVPQIWWRYGKLWMHSGPCVRFQSERENDVWNPRRSFWRSACTERCGGRWWAHLFHRTEI